MKLSSATATVFDAPAAYAVANGASQTNLRVVEVSEPRTRDEWDSARELIIEFFNWIAERTGTDPAAVRRAAADELSDLQSYYRAPQGRFCVARIDGVVVGATSVRQTEEPGVVEVKRVYIKPEARGHLLGPQLLDWALHAARGMGAETVRLETVPVFMQNAVKLYRSYGFDDVASYSDLGSRLQGLLSMERRLAR